MPRKCIATFDGQPCRTNYDATKKSPTEKNTVYGFPKSEDQQRRWLAALPKQPSCSISRTVGICAKHWHPDVEKVKVQGGTLRPIEPPSIFKQSDIDHVSPRNPNSRNVTADARKESEEASKMQAQKLSDIFDAIDSWDNLVQYAYKFSPEMIIDSSDVSSLRMFAISGMPPEVEFSIMIKSDFRIEAYRGHHKVPVRDLINGFSVCLSRYSQLDLIMERLRHFPIDVKSELCYVGNKLSRLSDEFADNLDDEEMATNDGEYVIPLDNRAKRRKLKFLSKQVSSMDKRSYDADDMANAMNLYLRSRSTYRALRQQLNLPARNTLFNYYGNLGLAGSEKECKKTLQKVFSKLSPKEKQCFVSFDEIHMKSGAHFQGKYVLGFAANTETPTPATNMLAIMVNPSFGAPPFVARLIPVHNMTGEFLYEELQKVMEMIHNVSGRVFALMCDDLAANQKVYKIYHKQFQSRSIAEIKHPFRNETFDSLFTLYDPVHLFKNIRNNWLTEKSQILNFLHPETKQTHTARGKDLVTIYNDEKGSPLTKLNGPTLYPNNFEKLKVALACNVFNEKTVAALKVRKMNDTAIFVEHVTKMWNILNVKSTSTGFHLNDDDRYPVYSSSDSRLDFLLNMATSFKLMDNSKKGSRNRGLTQETSSALHQTLYGLVNLARILLSTGHTYVLLGKLQSDPIEKEFGVYRQSHGGNYFVSAEQIVSSLQLQRLRLFSKLNLEVEDDDRNDTDCCDDDLWDNDDYLDMVEKAFPEASNLSTNEKSYLYYVAGYVAKKQGLYCVDDEEYDVNLIPESEFTTMLSRGKLRLPPLDLYDLSLYLYTFFKLFPRKCCTKLLLQAFEMIQQLSGNEFPDQQRINRRFLNTFFKTYTEKIRDDIKAAKDKRSTKLRRISSRK